MRDFIIVGLVVLCHVVASFDSFVHHKLQFRPVHFRLAKTLRESNRNELPSNMQITPQVAKLNAMAAKLRAEAAALEVNLTSMLTNHLFLHHLIRIG